jgi:membrane protease YdiL (CAAX protease family)
MPAEQLPDARVVAPHEETPRSRLSRIHPVGFALISLALVFFLYQFVAGGLTLFLFRGKVTAENVDLVRWATVGGELLCILLPTVLLARARSRNIVQYFRIRLPEAREIIVTIIAVFALQQVLQGYMTLQDALPLPTEIKRLVDTLKRVFDETYRLLVLANSPKEFLVVLVTVALIPAISEEMLFRGLVQRSFEEAVGGLRGAIIAGVIFGAYHLNPLSIVPLIALGAYFGFIVYRSHNITLGMSAHFFNNFVACTAVYLHLDDNFVAVSPGGGASSPAQIVNFVLFMLVFCTATYYFILITEPPDKAEHSPLE